LQRRPFDQEIFECNARSIATQLPPDAVDVSSFASFSNARHAVDADLQEASTMSSPRLNFLYAGALAGLVIVAGEALLNGWILLEAWSQSLTRLDLPAPSPVLVLAGFVKLFLLGYVVVWLYDTFAVRHGAGMGAALRSAAVVAGLVWVWVMLGLLMSGYVSWKIAWITMAWGIVELPLAAILAARVRRTPRAA
jgi:hypothetical protein